MTLCWSPCGACWSPTGLVAGAPHLLRCHRTPNTKPTPNRHHQVQLRCAHQKVRGDCTRATAAASSSSSSSRTKTTTAFGVCCCLHRAPPSSLGCGMHARSWLPFRPVCCRSLLTISCCCDRPPSHLIASHHVLPHARPRRTDRPAPRSNRLAPAFHCSCGPPLPPLSLCAPP